MANPIVIIETNKGNIKLELFEAEAPITVKNFLSYVDEGFYDNLIFHRVIKGFMIQGGGMDINMNSKEPHAPIKNEATNKLSNKIGTIAMARTQIVDSASSQFFINTANNDFLDFRAATSAMFGYCVFGKVIEGMETVTAIENVKTTSKLFYQDVPAEPVIINKAYRAE